MLRSAEEIMDRAERFVRHADSTLAHDSLERPRPQMQTTLTAVWGAGADLFFCHVGHSLADLVRGGQLMRLTQEVGSAVRLRSRALLAWSRNCAPSARGGDQKLTRASLP
jgi:serine/threonine protein phosphatase PrpC